MTDEEVRDFIAARSPYPIASGRITDAATVFILQNKNHVAAVSVSGLEMLGQNEAGKKDILEARTVRAVRELDRLSHEA